MNYASKLLSDLVYSHPVKRPSEASATSSDGVSSSNAHNNSAFYSSSHQMSSSHGSNDRLSASERLQSSLYGRAYPSRAYEEYWATFEENQALRRSMLSSNFASYERELLARMNPENDQHFQETSNSKKSVESSSPETLSVASEPFEFKSALLRQTAAKQTQKPPPHSQSNSQPSKPKYKKYESNVRVVPGGDGNLMSSLINTLRVGDPPYDALADEWTLLQRSQEMRSEYASDDSDPTEPLSPGHVEKLVSLQNSNIHGSSTAEECSALPYFQNLLAKEHPDIQDLKLLIQQAECCPPEHRAQTWQLLLGYLPTERSQWSATLRAKRSAYFELVLEHFIPPRDQGTPRGSTDYIIRMDVARTHPQGFANLFAHPLVRDALVRVLFVWSQVHADVEYFQGLNEIAVPFFLVYLSAHFGALSDYRHEFARNAEFKKRVQVVLPAVEADVFWSVDLLLRRLEASYTFTTGGVYAEPMMRVLERVLEMSNPEICRHFEKLQISLLQFTFRWCLCLMAREFTPRNVILLWDMYLADSHLLGFPVFHVYICAAFLKMFSSLVLEMGDMEKGLYLLQKPPTQYWDEYNIRELVWLARQIRADFPVDMEQLNSE